MKPLSLHPALAAIAAILIAVLGAFSYQIVVEPDGHTHIVIHRIVEPQPVVADQNNQLSKAEVKADEQSAGDKNTPDLHEDARDETPPGVDPADIEHGAVNTEAIAQSEMIPPAEPAGAQNYSCSQHPVVNQSGLTHRIIGVALHFTVSAAGSHEGVWRLFNTPSFGASSTFLWEPLTNLCWQLVPLDRKSWAQLTANSFYWSIEIVTNNLTRAQWLATPMIKQGKLAALVADLLHKAGAPPNLVDPVGCTFLPGVTDHSRLECGNTHWDVGPNFPWDVFMREVREHYYGASYTPACGARCQRANALRTKHVATHKSLKALNCNILHPRSPTCRRLAARNHAVHAAARREHIKL